MLNTSAGLLRPSLIKGGRSRWGGRSRQGGQSRWGGRSRRGLFLLLRDPRLLQHPRSRRERAGEEERLYPPRKWAHNIDNFLTSPWRGHLQLQDEQVCVQIDLQDPPGIFFKHFRQLLMRSVIFVFSCFFVINILDKLMRIELNIRGLAIGDWRLAADECRLP